jgi:hypothetical protein
MDRSGIISSTNRHKGDVNMALLWIDGFEGYGASSNPTTISARYPYSGSLDHSTIMPGRITGYSWGATANYSPYISTPVLTTNPTLISGCAFLFTTVGSYTILSFYDNATLGINVTFTSTAPNSTIVVKLGAATLATYTNFLLATYTWFYVEMKVFCHATSGTVEIKLNGTTVITLTGINTKAGSDSYHTAANIALWYGYVDDFYVCDGSGSAQNDFLGTCRVLGIFPNADTDVEQWTPSTIGAHYQLVDENPPNTSDYVESPTQGQIDLYRYPSLIGSGTIIGLQVSTTVEIATGTSMVIEAPIISHGVTDLGPDTTVTGATYVDVRHVSTTDPYTGLPWTVANLAAAQIGIRVM